MKQSIGSGRGSVYNIIMKALQSGDKYGYEICQEVETQTNGKYILKQPSLYSGLKRLESQKLVESYWGDSDIGGRRHYYKLTDAGRKKIESTNFSWEDEREDIVDNFFKKSELDQNIDNIQQSIDQTKNEVNSVIETNEQISNIFSGENAKIETTNSNQFAHKVNENQYDLFSYSNGIENKPTQTQSLFDFLPANEQSQTNKENASNEIVPTEKKESAMSSTQTENTTISQESVPEKVEPELVSDIINESTQNDSFVKPEQSRSFDYNSFFENRKTNSFSETKEEFTPTPQTYNNDLQSSSNAFITNTHQEETNTLNDDFDRKYAEFKAMFGSSDENKDQSGKTVDSTMSTTSAPHEEISKPVEPVIQEPTSPSDEQIRLEQERRMSDILSGNFQQNQDELKMTFDSNDNTNVQADNIPSQTEEIATTDTTKHENDELKNLNFKSIFGDLYDDREQQEKIETERQKFLDTYFAEKPKENEFQEFEQNLRDASENKNKQEELPRYDMSNNINYSLKPSDDYVPKKQTYAQTQEVSPTYETNEFAPNYPNQNFNSKNSVSFDKKCESRGYNFSDYEIRYLRQNNIDSKQTKFVKINKLNFFANITTSLIALILSLVCFFVLKQSQNHIQTLFYILDFTLVGLFVIYTLFTYLSDPNRRGVFRTSKKKIWLNLLISILVISAITCFNIFVLGMNSQNILSFSASFIIPIIIVILCFINPLLAILLHKFPIITK